MTASVSLSTCQSLGRVFSAPPGNPRRMSKITPKFIVDRLAAVERLERVRIAHDLSRGRFANTLGMYASNYPRLVKGEFFLTSDQLYTIWRLYGVEPIYIMEGREDGLPVGLREKIRALDATP